jgi:hypothetical protein
VERWFGVSVEWVGRWFDVAGFGFWYRWRGGSVWLKRSFRMV